MIGLNMDIWMIVGSTKGLSILVGQRIDSKARWTLPCWIKGFTTKFWPAKGFRMDVWMVLRLPKGLSIVAGPKIHLTDV